ncbi:DNA repair protein RadA [Christensenellaceae bacterium OttesenSCG-928-M15]|nr:DNA repair protein RadA [Christensenellaceae bacterium OttesenSCG-928-M15]
MAKNMKPQYICGECGYESAKWMGKCPGCGNWNTLVETAQVSMPSAGGVFARPLMDVSLADFSRRESGMQELDRVLGGGIVPGMVALLGGDPGIGKSTLLLQMAGHLAEHCDVLYITGEESAAQVKQRALRLHITSNILLLCETDLYAIEGEVLRLKPAVVIVDSIQTTYCKDISGASGSISQVREATAVLTRLAKKTGAALFVVGHVTKDGVMAGPRVLEHMVDMVLYFEGDRHADLRLLRAVKNRFGSTNEIGVFEMRDTGMHEVVDPSRLFLSGQHLAGCAVTCTLEGSRPMMAEVQALIAPSAFGSPRRTTAGVDTGRLSLLLAVLENKARLKLSDHDVYVNVVGGLKLVDRAVDLGVALCIASCKKETPLKEHTAAIGEVGLTGEVRAVSQMEKRMRECVRLGFSNLIVPRSFSENSSIDGAKLVPVRNIAEAVAIL